MNKHLGTKTFKNSHNSTAAIPTAKDMKAVTAYLRSIGTKGGSAKSDKKTAACRANAKKPRPGRKNKT